MESPFRRKALGMTVRSCFKDASLKVHALKAQHATADLSAGRDHST